MDIDGDRLGSESKLNDVEVNIASEVDITETPAASNYGGFGDDETSRLRSLAAEVVDQDELERNIGRQVSMSSIFVNPTNRTG